MCALLSGGFAVTQTNAQNVQATVSVTQLTFGSFVIGRNIPAETGYYTQQIQISNPGTSTLSLQGVTFTGANPNDFPVTWQNCSSITSQSPCTLYVNFDPRGLGPRSATLVINDNAASSPQTVSLTGTGLAPGNVVFTTASLDFGSQTIGAPGMTQTLTLTNAGASQSTFGYSYFQVTGDYREETDNCTTTSSTIGSLQPGQSCTVTVAFVPTASGPRTGSISITTYNGAAYVPISAALTGTGVTPLAFVPLTPCRVADTRLSGGIVSGQSTRDFPVQGATCDVPATAVAYSLNVTVVPSGPLGWLTLWPSGQTKPTASTLNSTDGRIKANAAIVPAGTSGGVSAFVSNDSHVILDINGYFVPVSTPSSLSFYSLTPCRLVDTRNSNAPLGGPFLAKGQSRDFPLTMSSCGLPAAAQAYALNITAVPHSKLSYLTTWPSGQNRPVVSTLNAPTGAVTANTAVVPAGQAGDISVFATDDTDLIVDVNGYFGAPATGGLSYYTQTPCRVFDTRNSTSAQPLTGQQSVTVAGNCSLPATAKAYVTNATVIPSGPLSFLTLWPDSGTRPNASTLNAYDGTVTSNMAVIPTQAGSLNVFSTNPTQLILDVTGYFAP